MKSRARKLKPGPVAPAAPLAVSVRSRYVQWSLLAAVIVLISGSWLIWSNHSAKTVAISDYVDPRICGTCHVDIAASFQKTGMGRSFYRPAAQNVVEDYTRKNVVNHQRSGFIYTMVERDGAYYQRRHTLDFEGKPANIVEQKIDYVIGSGNHARTYLHRTSQNKLVELPVSWYAERSGSWAMSPGYDNKNQEDIRRAITPECLFCHNGYPQLDETSKGKLAQPNVFPAELPEGIDCQRCHGPGRAHVTAASKRSPDPQLVRASILNPQDLTRKSQLELCMQCHLETSSRHMPNEIRAYGRDLLSYRPGQSLGDYKIYFDRAADRSKDQKDDTFEVAHAAYRLRKSKCFLQSEMTCTTCHDPHDIPRGGEAIKSYVAICQSCHQSVRHTAAMPASSNCISCHMPKRRTEDVVHVVMTDHYVQRYKPLRDLLAPMEETIGVETGTTVVSYYPEKLAQGPGSDLYLAVAQIHNDKHPEPLLKLQSILISQRPSAPEPYVALGQAYARRGDNTSAIQWFEDALKQRPEYLPAFRELVPALFAAGQDDRAIEVLNQAIARYPDDDQLLTNLGNVLLRRNRPNEAREALGKAIVANPERAEAHNLLGLIALQNGDKAAAEKAFREAIRWQPSLAEAQRNLGTLLTGTHAFAEAEFCFRRAIDQQPDYAEAHHGLGLLLILKGDMAAATLELKKSVQLQPASAQIHSDLADVFAAQNLGSEAAEEYRKVLALKPDQPDAHLGLGLALLQEHKVEEARPHLEQAAASNNPELSQAARQTLASLAR
jgi:predicted CXXCH cytochrome family protein